jgi:hypothetical protein
VGVGLICSNLIENGHYSSAHRIKLIKLKLFCSYDVKGQPIDGLVSVKHGFQCVCHPTMYNSQLLIGFCNVPLRKNISFYHGKLLFTMVKRYFCIHHGKVKFTVPNNHGECLISPWWN